MGTSCQHRGDVTLTARPPQTRDLTRNKPKTTHVQKEVSVLWGQDPKSPEYSACDQ